MMCYQLWSHLEKEANVELYRCTGLLVMGPEQGDYQVFKSTLERNKVPIVILPKEEFSQHIPHGNAALVDTTAGVLYVDRTIKTVQVIKMNVCYWREKVPGSYNVQHRFPCFIQLDMMASQQELGE
ncbi:unnamed protein product [Coregonus sp. 'balchen']|nr:unnamed protein product [Coregonus sp. 'balchen']